MTPAQLNIARAIARPRVNCWYPQTPTERRKCDTCGVEKIAPEFGSRSGNRTRNVTCRACAKEAARAKLSAIGLGRKKLRIVRDEPPLPNLHGEAKPGRVSQLCYCADCAEQGIISPVPAGKKCGWH